MIKFKKPGKLFLIVGIIFAGAVVAAIGALAGGSYANRNNQVCTNHHELLNKGVLCGNPPVLKKSEYSGLRNSLNSFIEQEKSAGRVNRVSYYFRDLHNGPAFGIEETEAFAPASLLKLPLALVYLRSAEVQPELLKHQLRYEGTTEADLQHFMPGKTAEPGKSYTIEELLKLMVSYSDNSSYDVLHQYLLNDPHRTELLTQGLQEMGVIAPQDKLDEVISTRGYAALFRMLYNITYINEELSQEALTWLSESDFNQGLVAGVPDSVKVAHKFGERFADSGDKQLHDCGIVYYTDNPYLVCVMTQGRDWNALAKIISEISEMTYKEVDSRSLK